MKKPLVNSLLLKEAISVNAGKTHRLLREYNKSGNLRYLAINLYEGTVNRIHVSLDKQDIINHTLQEIAASGDGRLCITAAYSAGGSIQVPNYSGNDYVLVLDFNANPLHFNEELVVEVKNEHASVAYKIRGALIIWELD